MARGSGSSEAEADADARHCLSGELLLFSSAFGSRSLPADLETWLRGSLSQGVVRARSREALRRVAATRHAVAARAQARREHLDVSKARMELNVSAARWALRDKEAELDAGSQAQLGGLDAQLAMLVLQYGAALAVERRGIADRIAAAERRLETERLVLQTRERLEMFALHLDHETRGAVRLRRLEARDAQHARCKRAAAENVRRGFFATDWRHHAIDVVDVYRIENRVLLDEFQHLTAAMAAAASAKDPDNKGAPTDKAATKQVKGIFTSVPAACVERLVVCGCRSDKRARRALEVALFDSNSNNNNGDNDNADVASATTSDSDSDNEPARPRKGAHLEEASGNGPNYGEKPRTAYARRLARAAAPVPFPREFSRYSTLEDLRPVAQHGGADEGDLRLLALCRVAVGRVKLVKAPDEAADPQAYDSTFCSVTESYRALRPDHVLPEFILVYRLEPSPTASNAASDDKDKEQQGTPRDDNDDRPPPVVTAILEDLRDRLKKAKEPASDPIISSPRLHSPRAAAKHQDPRPPSPTPFAVAAACAAARTAVDDLAPPTSTTLPDPPSQAVVPMPLEAALHEKRAIAHAIDTLLYNQRSSSLLSAAASSSGLIAASVSRPAHAKPPPRRGPGLTIET